MFDLVMVLSKIGDWTMSKLVIFPFLALCISCVKANVKANAGPGQKTIFADYSVISLLFRSFFLWLLKRKKEKEKKEKNLVSFRNEYFVLGVGWIVGVL